MNQSKTGKISQSPQYFTGDAKFASISQMMVDGPSSRKDDLINLLYLMIYLRAIELPWCDFLQCMPCDSHEKIFQMVLETKNIYDFERLLKRYKMPKEFNQIASLIENLEHFEFPCYSKIKGLLMAVVNKEQPPHRVYQWHRPLRNEICSKMFSDIECLLQEDAEDDSKLQEPSEVSSSNSGHQNFSFGH